MTTPDSHLGRRRAAAVLALVALAGALITLVVAFTSNLGEIIGCIVLVLAAAAGAWWALVERGVRRIVGAIVGVAAIVGVLVLLSGNVGGLLVFLACVLVAVALARYALSRDLPTLREYAISGQPVPAARRPVLIMNPKSGGGKVERFQLEAEARRRGIEPVLLNPGDDLRELAERAAAGGADVIGMAGGDGSQALVASVAMEHGIAYVCIPAGTRNHLALDIGLDRDDVVGALSAFGAAIERRIDLARIGDRVFVNNASLGVYAEAVQRPGYREAKLATISQTLPELMGKDAAPLDLRFTTPDGTAQTGAHVILVSNNPYRLARLDGLGSRVGLDSGRLGVVVVNIANAAAAARLLALESTGQARRFSGWQEWDSAAFTVDSGAPIAVGVDGEALVLEPPLEFVALPGALRVRLPTHAFGMAPAARAVAPLREAPRLVRTALGMQDPTAPRP
jgi:diacylglycerol kinase family enzyme